MALIFPIDRAFKITTLVNGNIGEFGAAGVGTTVGTWLFHFVPDATWTGSLAIVGRAAGEEAADANVALVQIPYRAIYLNTAVPAAAYGFDTSPITSTSIVQVPSNGLSVGVLIACSAGFGWLYTRNLDGSSAV